MDINDALEMLKQNKGGHLYDVYVPSLQTVVSFKQMTVAQHKSMAKMAIENLENFEKFICALITELSDGKIKLKEINEIDKNSIMYAVKHHNSSSPITLEIKCGKCEDKFKFTPEFDKVINKKDNLDNFVITSKIGDMEVEVEIGLPSVIENLTYNEYSTNRRKLLETKEDKDKLSVFIGSYEMYLLCIRGIKLNDVPVGDFTNNKMEDRFTLIDALNIECINVDEIKKWLEDTYTKFSYDINCPKCKHKFEDMMATKNFFF
jgi:hypothetical protein